MNSDLRGSTLRGAKLCETRLYGADLGRADLREADLTAADLTSAILRYANLQKADLHRADLHWADLRNADLNDATLTEADLFSADLRGVDLRNGHLREAHLEMADFSGATLRGAHLAGASLRSANLQHADLRSTELSNTTLVDADLRNADLSGARVFGTSVWNVKLDGATQANLTITPHGQSDVTVDDLEVAQFLYLILNNRKLRDVIDTITSKAVLILGRFTEGRKAVLEVIRNELRQRNYLPVLFDFELPDSRDITETVSTLAHMARFIVVDLTDARSVPQELMHVVPTLGSVPLKPVILDGQSPWAMFSSFQRYPWVLEVFSYRDVEHLTESIGPSIVQPAELAVRELRRKKDDRAPNGGIEPTR